MELSQFIRNIPDFPVAGVQFKDITTLLNNPTALKLAFDQMAEKHRVEKIDQIVGMESRGFIFGVPLAFILGCGFVPIRKPGKLPAEVIREEYSLEYGTNSLEIHKDAFQPGSNILIVDDLLATGGTAKAAANLISKLEGNIVGFDFLIEIEFLNGRKQIENYKINSYIIF